MYYPDRYDRSEPTSHSGAYFTAEEVRELAELMAELRSLTLSRRTFRTTSSFLSRFGSGSAESTLVEPDRLPQ